LKGTKEKKVNSSKTCTDSVTPKRFETKQCCGPGAFLTTGSGIRDGYKIRIRIRDEHPRSYFREFRNNFHFLCGSRIQDGKNSDPVSGMEIFGYGIRDINIPDPQH
jgi:hypothetical protein